MSFVGQCPSCHTLYELDADDVGHCLQCECGVALFACEVSGFDELPIHCPECQSDYVVDREASGDHVECECGAQITVPTIVLRAPVSETVSSSGATINEPSDQAKTKPRPIVTCPDCGKEFQVAKADLNQDSQCDCGCVFRTTLDADRKLVARALLTNNASKRDDEETGSHRKKGRSWFAILGTGSVIGFLIISVVMFVMRNAGTASTASTDEQTTAAEKNDSSGKYSIEAFASAIKSAGMRTLSTDLTSFSGHVETGTSRLAAEPIVRKAVSIDASEISRTGEGLGTKLRLPTLAAQPLPDPNEPRQRAKLVPASERGLTFSKAYETAFADFRETRDLKKAADGSRDPESLAEFQRRIGTTIGLLQQTHDLGMRIHVDEEFTDEDKLKKLTELRYFLTWAYFHAGWLPEAMLMGEAVTRWGNPDDAATKESAMFALAAAQEASATQWGISEQVGELERMQSIAELIAERWPEHPQLEAIWLNLGQLYHAFGKSTQAAKAYARIPQSSKQYSTAQLFAGNALWEEYRRNAPPEGKPAASLVAVRNAARKHFTNAVEALQKSEKKPTVAMLNAKLALVRIEILSEKPAEAVKWLNKAPFPLTTSIVVSKPAKDQIAMPASFVRAVFETLFVAKSQMDDPAGAKASLQKMSNLLGPGSGGEVGDKMLAVAIDYIGDLKASPTVDEKQITTLDGLLAPLKRKGQSLSADNLMWLGESYGEMAERATSPKLAEQCYVKAAESYNDALKARGFPKGSRTSARLRQALLLRKAGKLDEALSVTEQILKETPNVFQLQIEAAAAIEEIAIAKTNPLVLVNAVNGPPDSVIWGWSKLVTALHGVRFSPSGTDQHATQLLQCQFHLARCQWLLANAMSDQTERSKSIASVSKMLNRLLKTTPEDRQPWFDRLRQLHSKVDA